MILAFALALLPQDAPRQPALAPAQLRTAGALAGLEFTDAELKMMVRGATSNLRSYEQLRARAIGNEIAPALTFDPLLPGMVPRLRGIPPRVFELPRVQRPADLETLAFADIPTLAALIRSRQVSCVELAELFLARLERLDATLQCVITLTPERALARARELDTELAAGKWRGLLHGIPWGAKDLLAVAGYRTTWGAKPFESQVIERDATVVERLDAAGAVLIAKLTLGALAMGDVWYGGKTRNPWNPEQGSSGSSAGSCAATAAGCVPFAIGSETLGSIVSPSTRCGCTSLRPTFGRVSRDGAMALSWSMDKLGPICRSFEDAAIVFEAIQGPDGRDPTVKEFPFTIPARVPVTGWKVGYVERAFARDRRGRQVLEDLRTLGVELVPIELPDYPINALRVILNAEAACAFDELSRDGRDDLLVRQDPGAWPTSFRVARLIPAVEYLRACRVRAQLMRDTHAAMEGVVAIVHPSFAGSLLTLTNLTGHPTAVAPSGFRENGTPTSISFTGQLFGEAALLALATAWQRATDHHRRHPEIE